MVAGHDKPGQHVGVGAWPARKQPSHRIVRATAIDIELRQQLVRHLKIRIQLQRPPKGPDEGPPMRDD